MNIGNPLFIFTIVLAIAALLVAFLFKYNPPKNINHFYGYKTKGSMKSQFTWDYAHKYSSKWMLFIGVVFSLIALIVLILNPNNGYLIMLDFLLFIVLSFIMIYKTEQKLKKIE